MSAKRFRKVLGLIEDNQGDGDGLLDLGDIEVMLNRQHEKIIQLEKENQSLKKELYNCEEDYINEEYL